MENILITEADLQALVADDVETFAAQPAAADDGFCNATDIVIPILSGLKETIKNPFAKIGIGLAITALQALRSKKGC